MVRRQDPSWLRLRWLVTDLVHLIPDLVHAGALLPSAGPHSWLMPLLQSTLCQGDRVDGGDRSDSLGASAVLRGLAGDWPSPLAGPDNTMAVRVALGPTMAADLGFPAQIYFSSAEVLGFF